MKKFKKNGIILIILTCIILFVILKDDFTSIIDLLKNASPLWLSVACLLQIAVFWFESLAFDQIIKSYNPSHPFKKTFQLTLITKFFNGITPFSTGGQPMQVHYLRKDGFRLTKATNIIMQNFILYQLALITVGSFAVIMNFFYNYFAKIPFLQYLVTLGFFINVMVMVILFVVSFSNRFNKTIINFGLNVLYKFHIIKDKESQKDRWMERCNDFHEGATYIKEHKVLCIKGFVYNVIALLCFYMIPFFLFKALDESIVLHLVPTIVASSYVLIIGSFVAIPGASGGIEYGFLEFFSNFIKGSLLPATLLIYRAITYYLPMIIGAIILNFRKES